MRETERKRERGGVWFGGRPSLAGQMDFLTKKKCLKLPDSSEDDFFSSWNISPCSIIRETSSSISSLPLSLTPPPSMPAKAEGEANNKYPSPPPFPFVFFPSFPFSSLFFVSCLRIRKVRREKLGHFFASLSFFFLVAPPSPPLPSLG